MTDAGDNLGGVAIAPAPSTERRGSAPDGDVLAAVIDGVLAVDDAGTVTLLNPAAERLLGVPAMAALGRPFAELRDTGELLDALREELPRVDEARETERVVEVHREGDADLAYVRIGARVLRDHRGAARGTIFQLQDVTSGHKTDQLKNQYLSIVAHELRTPLTGIKTFSTMMAKGVLGELNEKQAEVIASIREQSLRLEHQIDKLVNLGHIDSSNYGQDLDEIDAVEIVRQSVSAFEVPAQDRSIALSVRVPPEPRRVQGDRADLKRAMQALVENAIKFTKDGGAVAVEVVDAGDSRVEISVRDDGVGIEPRYHGRIFEKFFQVEDPLTRHHGGSGLGLFFVKSIVEAHGGTVRVDSRLGEGARFSFELTRASSADSAAGTTQSTNPIPAND